MALSPRIELRQSQSLVMTPQLQQAIKLLQMSNLDLSDYLTAEAEKNPLIELAPRAAPASAPVGAARRGDGDGSSWLEGMAAEPTLRDHLRAQIGAMRARPEAVAAALILVDELDDDGYLRTPVVEIVARHQLRARELTEGLALVQACDPAGVGARSLRECLALQLRDRDRLDPAMQVLLDNLALAARGRSGELQALCGVDAEDVADMLAELRALDPKPGLRFAAVPVELAVPDVYVARVSGGTWAVELNGETLPRVLVNNVYAARLGGRDPAARAFISECSASANWLVRSIEQRARTILRVSTEIVRRQERFFGLGAAELRPLTQRAVAEQLNLHESTVSRVTSGKYLACDQGCFEFRYFFSPSIQAIAGGEAFSAAAVQERIRNLVQSEGPAFALSDDKIVTLLNAGGVDIARRTVAKYREAMGIPSSVERRRLKTSLSGKGPRPGAGAAQD
jgi:RNA polymerase sigma-54 factor